MLQKKQKVATSISTTMFNVDNVSGVESHTCFKSSREIPPGCFCVFMGSQGELEEDMRGGAKHHTWANQQTGGKTETKLFYH